MVLLDSPSCLDLSQFPYIGQECRLSLRSASIARDITWGALKPFLKCYFHLISGRAAGIGSFGTVSPQVTGAFSNLVRKVTCVSKNSSLRMPVTSLAGLSVRSGGDAELCLSAPLTPIQSDGRDPNPNSSLGLCWDLAPLLLACGHCPRGGHLGLFKSSLSLPCSFCLTFQKYLQGPIFRSFCSFPMTLIGHDAGKSACVPHQ